ncbi:MAG: DUF4173 domain-containing protein, partial [Clostridiales bacterium]|nr:DUF4173 domain-containing protein [Clostridiales bacterium]
TQKMGAGRRITSIMLGLLLSLLIAGMVLPLLMKADSGGFYKIAIGIYHYLQWFKSRFAEFFFEVIIAFPIGMYLFGLIAGCAHGRGCNTFKKEETQTAIDAMRIFETATVYTVLLLVCFLYLTFILSQIPYFFSAFAGVCPVGFQVYSEYARNGFFELIKIAAINLSLLTAANLLCKKPRRESNLLKILNVALSLLTLLMITTAFSKMALYISVYGLSVRRLLPCLFLVFLAVIFLGVIVLQKWQFSIMRLAAITGAVMICMLSLLNPDGFVANYNADRYLSGTLHTFDTEIVSRAGAAGVDAAIRVYSKTNDKVLKTQLITVLENVRKQTETVRKTAGDNLQIAHARQKISEFLATNPV